MKFNYHRLISDKILGHYTTNTDELNEYYQRWLQNTILDNNNILIANNAKIIHSYLGSMTIQLPNTSQLLQCILYNNYVPSELRKIIDDYYGEDGPTEKLMYTLLAKSVYYLKTNVLTESDLPYADNEPRIFTIWLKYYFKIYINYYIGRILYKEPFISPKLFYKFYKEVNKLDDDFVPPLTDKNKAPSLIPILPVNLRPSTSYELSTEYPDD